MRTRGAVCAQLITPSGDTPLAMMNNLSLFRENELLVQRSLGEEALEIGSSRSADFVVDDSSLPARAYLVQARGGTVWLFDLSRPKLQPQVLALNTPLKLGDKHRLVRTTTPRDPVNRGEGPTLQLQQEPPPRVRWTVLVGRGSDARRVTIGEKPIRVGKGAHNELVLHDPTVSYEHCRFEPEGRVLCLRDLDSTNGTYVQGLRVTRAQLSAGTRVRVGRTDLHVLAATDDGRQQQAPLVAASVSMQETVEKAQRFAQLPWPLLILGPSGAGKEELSRLVHNQGTRRKNPFVALNAGGLPRELIESELFGHEKGAFTGAVAQRKGVFEQAHGGTLFLDEIGELPLDLQARLLRVLETWQVRRVGGETPIDVDVRVVCATHRDLLKMVHEGTFRQDLYYRLARLVLRIAPLSARKDDVVPLAEHFLRAAAADIGERTLSEGAKAKLLAYEWPGNARELRNVLCGAAALSPAAVLDTQDIEQAISTLSGDPQSTQLDAVTVEQALARCGGNLSATARLLSVPRSTLRGWLKRGEFASRDDDYSSPSLSMSSSSSPK